MDEIVPTTPEDFHQPMPDSLVLVEVGDIFEEMRCNILQHGEIPAIDTDRITYGLDAFMMDVFQQLGYLPGGFQGIAPNIDCVLDTCGQYFDVYHLSPVQYWAWRHAAQQLVHRFVALGMYDKSHVHICDYHQLRTDTLVLKLFL